MSAFEGPLSCPQQAAEELRILMAVVLCHGSLVVSPNTKTLDISLTSWEPEVWEVDKHT